MTSNLRETNMEARRQRILDAAAAIISESGPDALSMRPLAKEVGLSVTTLYNLYGSKEAILGALQERFISSLEQELRDLPWHIDPIARCRYVMTNPVEFMVANKRLARTLMGRTSIQVIAPNQGKGFHARGAGMQEEALKEAMRHGLIEKTIAPDILASHLYFSWAAASDLWCAEEISDDEFEARVDFTLVYGLIPVACDQLKPELEREMLALSKRLSPVKRKTAPTTDVAEAG